MQRIARDGIAAASATYRTATNVVAQRLKVRADHTDFPKEDFLRQVGLIEPKSRERAMKFYDLGVRRGVKQATDWFADGTIKYQHHNVVAPTTLTVKSKIKFSGSQWQPRRVKIKTEDIGFQ
jgi:hypothetical protein